MYGKLFDSIYDGTLGQQWKALVTFEQMVILCDRDGVVDMTRSALSRRTGIPAEIINPGISLLEEEDPNSRSPAEGGRRIVRLDAHRDWGWRIVNHLQYRDMKNLEEQRRQNRESQARRRKRTRPDRDQTESDTVSPDQPPSSSVSTSQHESSDVINDQPESDTVSPDQPPSAHTDADTDTDADTNTGTGEVLGGLGGKSSPGEILGTPSAQSCAENAHSPPESGLTPGVSTLSLPLVGKGGGAYSVTQTLLDELRELYPRVDVPEAMRSIRAWLLANPKRRKTRRGIRRFIHGWLDREQNSTSRGSTSPPTADPRAEADRAYLERMETAHA